MEGGEAERALTRRFGKAELPVNFVVLSPEFHRNSTEFTRIPQNFILISPEYRIGAPQTRGIAQLSLPTTRIYARTMPGISTVVQPWLTSKSLTCRFLIWYCVGPTPKLPELHLRPSPLRRRSNIRLPELHLHPSPLPGRSKIRQVVWMRGHRYVSYHLSEGIVE